MESHYRFRRTGTPGVFRGGSTMTGRSVRENGGMEMPRNDRSQESPQVLILGQDGTALGGTD